MERLSWSAMCSSPSQCPRPAFRPVVMMHGRSGAYSTRARGTYDASTLSGRHQTWGRLWTQSGYIAILVDGFGPRGYAQGFPRFSYETGRPRSMRVTCEAAGCLWRAGLPAARPDVIGEGIALQGWSNGGSATLAAMSIDAPGIHAPTPSPASAPRSPSTQLAGSGPVQDGFRPYAPVRVFHGQPTRKYHPPDAAASSLPAVRRAAISRFSFTTGATTASTTPPGGVSAFAPMPTQAIRLNMSLASCVARFRLIPSQKADRCGQEMASDPKGPSAPRPRWWAVFSNFCHRLKVPRQSALGPDEPAAVDQTFSGPTSSDHRGGRPDASASLGPPGPGPAAGGPDASASFGSSA